ncbi:MAG: hypothetical protein CMI15_03560 [Opitutaceae bacterium]|nr:hypothetical protein [Opitutaceae bacterium]
MSFIESFQSNRIADRLHAIVQFLLVFMILAAINAIAMRSYTRFDTTLNRSFTLSAQTVAYLQQLQQPINIIVTLTDQSRDLGIRGIYQDVKSLLSEYEYETRNQGENRVRIEYLDIYQQARRAKELGITEENAIVFNPRSQNKIVRIDELYSLSQGDIQEFLGETVFTQTILEISQDDRPKIYFATGHGELDPNNFSPDLGISQFADELESRNFATESLDFSTITDIPNDARLLIIPAPRSPFLPREQEILKSYLRRDSGRIILMIEPGSEHGLDDLLFEWGILADDAIAVEMSRDSQIEGGDLLVRRFAPHPITNELLRLNMTLVTDRARVVREDPGRPIDESLLVKELMATSDKSWGEKNFKSDSPPVYDSTVDLRGPVRVAAVSERKVDSSLGISIPGGRLIVFGTSNFLTNNRISASGNLFLALNSVNYAIDRVAQLNIPPRPIRKVKLDLSMEQLLLSRYLIWLGPPALVGLLGILMYLARRQ